MMNGQNFNCLGGGQERLMDKCFNFLKHSKPENTDGKNTTSKSFVEDNNSNKMNNQREDTLFNLMDDITSLHINNNSDSFTDRQMKELLNFVTTSANCCNNKSALTQDEERQYKDFFDKHEGKMQSYKVSNTHVANAQGSSLYHIHEDHIGKPKVLIPKISNEADIYINEDLIDEILLDKSIQKQILRSATPQFIEETVPTNKVNSPSPFPNKKYSTGATDATDIMDEIIRSNTINFTIKPSRNAYETESVHENLTYLTKDRTRQKMNTATNDLVTKYDVKYLEAMIIDEKLKKICTFKTENEKLHLTPGPTLNEKSIVLSQIMKRLTDKKKKIEDQNNVTPKLVLDAGSSYKVIGKDKENKKKITENHQTSFNQTAHINGLQIHVNSDVRKQTVEPYMYKSSQSTSQTSTPSKREGDIRFVPVEKLKALYTDGELIKIGPHVLKPPEPLARDCNKERYVSYATSHLFNDFIQKSNITYWH